MLRLLIKIKNIIPAVIGTLQAVLPIIKEALVDLTRVCEIVFFWTDFDEKVIAKINKVYAVVYEWVEKFKNWTL